MYGVLDQHLGAGGLRLYDAGHGFSEAIKLVRQDGRMGLGKVDCLIDWTI